MKKFLICLALSAFTLPDGMAYDVKMEPFCFDIVGTDTNGNRLLELVKGDTEFDANRSYRVQLHGYDYTVVSVGAEAFSGIEALAIYFEGQDMPTEKFTFKENCFKGSTLATFPRVNVSGPNSADFEVVYEPGCFADVNIKTNITVKYTLAQKSTVMAGAFTGSHLADLTVGKQSDLHGGAFDAELTTVHFRASVRTVTDGAKVFPGMTSLDIIQANVNAVDPISVNRLTDLTDFASRDVAVSIQNIFEVVDAGEDGGSSFPSTVTVPGFLVNAYQENPVWKRFNIAADNDYVTDTTGKYYLYAYKIPDGGAFADIIGYNGTPGAELIIPEVINANGVDYKVSHIFSGPFTGRTEITSLELPLNCQVLSRAFAGCTGLKSVKIAGSGLNAKSFDGCPVTDLEVVTGVSASYGPDGRPQPIFNNTVTRLTLGVNCGTMELPNALAPGAVIESYAGIAPRLAEQSQDVYSTAKVTVPYGTFSVYKAADIWKNFADVTERAYDGTTFTAEPFMIKVLDKETRKCAITALSGTPQGAVLTIPATVTAPDGTEFTPVKLFGMLLEGTSFKEVVINAPVDTIGGYAFARMPNLKKIEIPNTVTGLLSYAFTECPSLTEVKLSDNLKSLTWGLFKDCTALEKVDIPAGVTKIEDNVFAGCIKLSTITLPATVESIGGRCFEGTQLSMLELAPSATPLKTNMSFLTSPSVPNTIDCLRVGRDVVLYARSDFDENSIVPGPVFNPGNPVNRVELGSMVSSFTWFPTYAIADNATLVSDAAVPPALNEFTMPQYQDMTVNVPASALETYRSADVWKEFLNITGSAGINEVTAAPADGPVYDLSGCRVAEQMEGATLAPGIYIQAGRKIIVR